jgi:Fe-S oxidoreductase
VLLFPDTFVQSFEPLLGFQALALLRTIGIPARIGLPEGAAAETKDPTTRPSRLRCCGRPLISNGLLSKAADYARHNVEQLYPWAAATGNPIIACEPSCILTIKDDYPALLRGDARRKAEKVAAVCQTFEQFLESRLAAADKQIVWSSHPRPKRILAQSHCHERSLVGTEAALRLLGRIPRAEVVDLDAGCCGMAGSFGYEKEHYEISRMVGEQRLFPAIRQADASTVIVASGFSCRMQIKHFTGRTALHPAQLLYSLIVKKNEAR